MRYRGSMARQGTLNISLPPELDEFVAARVRSGRFESPSDVVHEGLRLLRDREAALDDVRAKIAVGLEQALRGELLDGDEVFDELDRQDEETAA